MSNRRRITKRCAVPGCHDEAVVVGVTFLDGEEPWGPETPLREAHAVEAMAGFRGKVWADAQCDCGRVHRIARRAGRRVEGKI